MIALKCWRRRDPAFHYLRNFEIQNAPRSHCYLQRLISSNLTNVRCSLRDFQGRHVEHEGVRQTSLGKHLRRPEERLEGNAFFICTAEDDMPNSQGVLESLPHL